MLLVARNINEIATQLSFILTLVNAPVYCLPTVVDNDDFIPSAAVHVTTIISESSRSC